jgi:hypothetical protein
MQLPAAASATTGCFRLNLSDRQSRKATFRIAFDWPSVFLLVHPGRDVESGAKTYGAGLG